MNDQIIDLSFLAASLPPTDKENWCECGKGLDNPVFFNDGEHEEIYKHHWRCNSCDGIIQIG